jgi:hypothetical protein
MPRSLAPLLVLVALSGCVGGEERVSFKPDPAEFVAAVDARCDRTRTATRNGPRFPYRDFDPANPDGRLRKVGRFYERLDSEGTVTGLSADLRKLDPPRSVESAYTEMLGSMDALVTAMRRQTRAAAAGARKRMIEATEAVDAAFDELGMTASDIGAFRCALSLERNPKTIR